MRTVIYARQSLDRTGDSLAVVRQLDLCREFARQRGWTVEAELVDNDTSATSGVARPAFERLLESRPERVVVWHIDRLVRLTRDLERVIETGANVHAVKAGHVDLSNPAGRAVARTVTAWATYEGEQKAERQKASNDQRAAAGRPPAGRRCYGYAADGLSIVEHEAAHVRFAAKQVLDGVPLRTVLRKVSEQGSRTTAGNLWQPTQFRRYLTNPRIAAQRMHRGELVGEGAWPPILTMQEHTGLVAILSDPARRPLGRPNVYLLSGVARCGTCGGRIYGRVERRGPIYVCESHAHLGRKIADIDAFVSAHIVARLSRPDAHRAFTTPEDTARSDALRSEQRTLTDRLDALAEAFATGTITARQMTAGTAKVRERLDEIDTALPALASTKSVRTIVTAVDVAAAWQAQPTEVQREIIGMLVAVIVHPAGRGARYFDPVTVTVRPKSPASAQPRKGT